MSKLPKGWEIVKLSKLLKLKGGNAFKSNDFIDKGIPVLKISNINKSGQIDLKDYVCVEELEEYKDYLLAENDIVVAMSGATTGKMGRVKFKDLPLYLNQRVGKFEIKNKDILDNDFLYFNVNSPQFIEKLLVNAIGGAQPNISSKQIEELEIPIPPLEEQKKIADILSTVDKKIAFVEENINATEELKKGLMQKLLTEGIGHTEFKDSELGRIPESWEVIPFIELADKNIKHSFTGGPFGSDLKSEHYTDIGVRVIQLQNIGDGYFINNDFVYVSEEKAESLKSCQIYPNDIILAKMAEPVARACLIPDIESKYIMCSDGIRLKVDNSKFNTEFIFYSINYDNFRKIAVAKSNGTTRLRIGLSALKSIPILIPPLEEQKQIAEILSTVDKKLENLKEKKQSFEELKKGLMQKLLTGEVRI